MAKRLEKANVASSTRKFDLALSYPQWQGSGRGENLLRGARAAAGVCSRFAPMAKVPLAETEGDGSGVNRLVPILEQFRSAQTILERHRGKTILAAGGDCAVDIAIIDHLIGVYPDLTVIWVDSHFDANTPATSPSGNLHGMPVAAIMGEAPEDMRPLLRHALSPTRFRYVWANVADKGDRAFQAAKELAWLQDDERLPGPVHIHFDLDALDPRAFPFLAYPEPNGMPIATAMSLLRRLARNCEIVGLTFTEFAPADEEEARIGAEVIAALCEAVREGPRQDP